MRCGVAMLIITVGVASVHAVDRQEIPFDVPTVKPETQCPTVERWVNSWSLFDMLGNVYEWCEDWKGPYPIGEVTDPHGPSEGPGRVIRGGSWMIHANRARAEFRDFLAPDERREDLGFRVAAVERVP